MMEILLLILIASAVVLALHHMKKHPGCSGGCVGCTMPCDKAGRNDSRDRHSEKET